MKLLGRTESKITKDKNGDNVPRLEVPTNHIFLKTFNSEFQEIKISFTDQTSKLLEVEDKINLTLIIK